MPVFLFTDIEGSTGLWEKHPQAMPGVLRRHDAILLEELERHGGRLIDHMGDGIYAVFDGGRPLQCVIEIQKRLGREPWAGIGELRVRLALNGRPPGREGNDYFREGDDYFGPAVNHTARIMGAAWGGQILLTPEVLTLDELPAGATLHNLGAHAFRGLDQPQQIYGLLHPDLPLQTFPPLRSLSARANNLPAPATPFIGREAELAQISQLLATPGCRLLTLVGPGGIGKTRLALAAAGAQLPATPGEGDPFAHGVYFVPLAALTTPDHVVPAVADALHFSFYEGGNSQKQLLDYLAPKKMLLVLDNFEHLLAGNGASASHLLAGILTNAPELRLLVTSRVRLNLQAEWTLPVAGIGYPPETISPAEAENYAAVQLFLQGLRKANPHYGLTDEDRAAIVHICRMLEGLPLGIELASAWTRLLSIPEIAEELAHNLAFLASAAHDAPERHQSLQAVFDSSWKLLAAEEQRAMRQASVFCQGFRREAAAEVAGANLALLAALIDKSFLRRSPAGRYELHETIRHFGAARLAEEPQEEAATRERHSAYYGRFLAQRRDRLRGREQKQTVEEVGPEIENIRTGWQWALGQGQAGLIEQYLEGLYRFYWIRGYFQEGLEAFNAAAAVLAPPAPAGATQEILLGKALARQGSFAYRLGLREMANNLLEKSLAIFQRHDHLQEIAYACCYLGAAAYLQSKHIEAGQRLLESLAIYRQINDRLGLAIVLHHLGLVAYTQENHEEARQWHEESLAIARELGEPFSIAVSLNNLGLVACAQGAYGEAEELHQASLAICREIGDRWGIAKALQDLGQVALTRQAYSQARPRLEESLAIYQEIGVRPRIAATLQLLSQVAEAQGQPAEAARFRAESLAL
ncbi:MAG: tetratricopeptide repeat protein [Chloroflexi bacterium]|nr:tetratricopeptide repeat protein [Chloroflexota bacterium]MCI0576190.1 tetratricopeptide repeat protein [Chloroflexota bacterium]MCI0645516.1 tetratricopeptide repeat protein [Chloroflexota bacterium]MCI0730655.1 tetratricopeptide repeat protein [Chloroflexota bacterium]